MLILKNSLVTLFLFSSMLAMSFLLSLVTILAHQRVDAYEIAYMPSIERETRTIQLLENIPKPSDHQRTEDDAPSSLKASNSFEAIPLAISHQVEKEQTTDQMNVSHNRDESGEQSRSGSANESDLVQDDIKLVIVNDIASSDTNDFIQIASDEGHLSESDEAASNEQDLNQIESNLNEQPEKKEMALQSASSSLGCVEAWANMESEHVNEGICIELYRDNGDMLPNSSHDILVGFTLMMDESPLNLDYYEFTNLPQGYYFAKFYQLDEDSAFLRQVEGSVEGQKESSSELTATTDMINHEQFHIWDTILLEATPLELGYCVRFEQNSKI